MPRVVHLTTVHPPDDPRIFWKQAASLARAGYTTHLIARHGQQERREGVEIIPLPPGRGRYRRVVLQHRAYRAARALQADLYHLHDPELIPVGYALKRALGARIVYDMHENNFVRRGPLRALARRLERWACSWVDHLILAEESYAGFVPAATPQTVILNYFRPFGQPTPSPKTRDDEPLRLLSAGVQGAARGVFTLLDLAARARTAKLPMHLTLAGICYEPRTRAAAAERIRREQLREIVTRAGWEAYLPWPALERHYTEAHVGLALFAGDPNHVASVPTKFYEYLFYGLPLLCSDFPLWRQFVERHGCGAVVPPGDAAAAVAVLHRWHADPEAYARLSAAAASAANAYLWPAMEARLLALYKTLLAPAALNGR